MRSQQKPQKAQAPGWGAFTEPWVPLVLGSLTGLCLIHACFSRPGHLMEADFGMCRAVGALLPGIAMAYEQQPARRLEYSLALNAALLLFGAGTISAFRSVPLTVASGLYLGGLALAVAATVVDVLARCQARRRAVS